MDNNYSPIDIWNFLKFSEKQHLMLEFRKLLGNHYKMNDFLKFIVEHSKGVRGTSKLVDGNPLDGRNK